MLAITRSWRATSESQSRCRASSRSSMMSLDEMADLLGGRAAEELVFGDRSAGSAGDFQRVGEIAHKLVCDLGMSDALGPLPYGSADGRIPSEEGARIIHREARRLADNAYQRARAVLVASSDSLDGVAMALLERETVTAVEFEALLGPARRPRGVCCNPGGSASIGNQLLDTPRID